MSSKSPARWRKRYGSLLRSCSRGTWRISAATRPTAARRGHNGFHDLDVDLAGRRSRRRQAQCRADAPAAESALPIERGARVEHSFDEENERQLILTRRFSAPLSLSPFRQHVQQPGLIVRPGKSRRRSFAFAPSLASIFYQLFNKKVSGLSLRRVAA